MAISSGFTRLGKDLYRVPRRPASAKPENVAYSASPFQTDSAAPIPETPTSGFETLDAGGASTSSPSGSTDNSLAGRMSLAAQLGPMTSPLNVTLGLLGLMTPSPVSPVLAAGKMAMEAHNNLALQQGLRGLNLNTAAMTQDEEVAALMELLNEMGPATEAQMAQFTPAQLTAAGNLGISNPAAQGFAFSGSKSGMVDIAGKQLGPDLQDPDLNVNIPDPNMDDPNAPPAQDAPPDEGISTSEGTGAPAAPAGDAPADAGGNVSGVYKSGGYVGPGGGTVESGEYVVPAGGFAELLRAASPDERAYGRKLAGSHMAMNPTDLLRLLPMLQSLISELFRRFPGQAPAGAPREPTMPQGGHPDETPMGSPGPAQPDQQGGVGSSRQGIRALKKMALEFG